MTSLLYTNEKSVHQNKVVRLSYFGKIVGIVDFFISVVVEWPDGFCS